VSILLDFSGYVSLAIPCARLALYIGQHGCARY
jgi:hypothetical protein